MPLFSRRRAKRRTVVGDVGGVGACVDGCNGQRLCAAEGGARPQLAGAQLSAEAEVQASQ